MAGFADTRVHYPALDGLRGIAALAVVLFHLGEIHVGSPQARLINHGYLAVDFFFMLSGFVIGYAYDGRWQAMSIGGFFKRRLIRLHPLVVVSMLLGAATFYLQDCAQFPRIAETPPWQLLAVLAVGLTLLPLTPALDVRGWNEMHPLNGPAWSLFYEYVANILYALVLRRLSNPMLAAGALLAALALGAEAWQRPTGDIYGGWTLEPEHVRLAVTRLAYPLFAGLLLSRLDLGWRIARPFWPCAVLLLAVLAMPRLGGPAWVNGMYEALCIVLVFPLVVTLAANKAGGGAACRWLGELSYPLYILHYPLVYVYAAWVLRERIGAAAALPVALLTFAGCVLLAALCGRLVDLPLRRWLARRYLRP